MHLSENEKRHKRRHKYDAKHLHQAQGIRSKRGEVKGLAWCRIQASSVSLARYLHGHFAKPRAKVIEHKAGGGAERLHYCCDSLWQDLAICTVSSFFVFRDKEAKRGNEGGGGEAGEQGGEKEKGNEKEKKEEEEEEEGGA